MILLVKLRIGVYVNGPLLHTFKRLVDVVPFSIFSAMQSISMHFMPMKNLQKTNTRRHFSAFMIVVFQVQTERLWSWHMAVFCKYRMYSMKII